jgi:hypothetical protein
MISIPNVTPYTSFFGFLVGLPTLVATYYQSWTNRRENQEARKRLIFSGNCLEYVLEDGRLINLVALGTLHSLPRAGDIVLLPGSDGDGLEGSGYGAYCVTRIEHIYTRSKDAKGSDHLARLIKAVAHVDVVQAPEFEEPVGVGSMQVRTSAALA